MSFRIVTDSSATLDRSIFEEYNIAVLSLSYMINDVQTKIDPRDPNYSPEAFYAKMREGAAPSTSLPNQADTRAILTEILDEGSDLLYIGFDSALSGTYQATASMLDMLAADYPTQKIFHVDTLLAAGSQGLMVYRAACMERAGASIEDTAAWVQENIWKIASWFTVDDLNYLCRGGRLSRTAALAGSLLNIKPVLRVDETGALVPVENVRGRKKAINSLYNHFAQAHTEITDDTIVAIVHSGALEEAQKLRDKIEKDFGVKHFFINWLDPVIGSHTGPGVLSIYYMSNNRM